MSDLLSISSTAVMAYQRALGTVSNNIANVGTEGYSRQEVSLTANTPSKQGNVYIGNGVRFTGIQRQVNDFVQSNLRNSQSELATQEPMVSYANRVVDIMGGEQTGLTTALNRFFDASRVLSGDPSSSIYRAAFLRESDSLTSSFRELSGQMQLIDDETREATDARLGELNTLVSQLALINKQLAKNTTETKQPPELLDQRDRVLGQISKLSRISTKFEFSGEVSVSLGASMEEGLVLDGQDASPVTAVFDPVSPEKVALYIGQFSAKPRTLSSLTGGEVGGLLAFREQVLNPARDALDDLAKTLVAEVNQIHKDSMDAYGNPGTDLFGFDLTKTYFSEGMRLLINDTLKVAAAAQFRVAEDSNNPTSAVATLSYSPGEENNQSDISSVLSSNGTLDSGVPMAVSASQPFKVVATVREGTTNAVMYLDQLSPTQEIQVLTREGVHVAGKPFTDDQESMILRPQYGFEAGSNYDIKYLNQQGDQAYKQSDIFIGTKAAPMLSQVFDDSGAAMEGKPIPARLVGGAISGSLSGLVVAAGALELNGIALGELRAKTDTLQASEIATWVNTALPNEITRADDGRSIVPQARLPLDQVLRFEGLNGDIVTITPPIDTRTGKMGFANAQALAQAINERTAVHLVSAEIDGDGSLILNQAASAAWMTKIPGMTAHAYNKISTPIEKLDLKVGLTLKGHSGSEVSIAGPFESAHELVDSINAQRATTKVQASISTDGEFILTNLSGYEGENISVGSLSSQPGNTLRLPNAYTPQVFGGRLEIVRSLSDPNADEIRIGLGVNGHAADLQRIGLRAGVYFSDSSADDYLVMVTGEGTFSASATYKASEIDPTERLRESPFDVVFTDEAHYTITDRITGSVVANRDFDPKMLPPEITYRGVTLTFTSAPSTGDRFSVDGNRDGLGDNRGILRMVALEGNKIMSGGRTLTEAYIDEVSKVGNLAQRALVARDALTVVFDQAKEARDSVSGVSLDEEAASLIRFQQAYQASAKVMQTASNLFDAILRVN